MISLCRVVLKPSLLCIVSLIPTLWIGPPPACVNSKIQHENHKN